MFVVHGDAGVGKTVLAQQLREAARNAGALTAFTDHRVLGATETMAAIAAELAAQGCRLRDFERAYSGYQERRAEVEADPQAPEGTAAYITRTAARVALKAAGDIPVAGALIEVVDADAFARQMENLRVFVSRKLRSSADVRLLLSPVEVLSPLLVAGINEVRGARPVTLFFDTYERTGPLLDEWLLDMLEGRYGLLPENSVFVLSGQHGLDGNRWAPLRGYVCELPLVPFTDAEARLFLAQKGITENRVVDVVLRLSGRLPLLVALLAEHQPVNAEAVGDPSGSAVERFLRWEEDPQRRFAAMAGALPRRLNQDVLGVLVTDEAAASLHSWLLRMPFVTDSAGVCLYHEVVRAAMLRLQRNQSPERWKQHHLALAAYFQGDEPGAGTDGAAQSAELTSYQELALESVYHRLCAGGASFLPSALRQAARCEVDPDEARAWALAIEQAGIDGADEAVRGWGKSLRSALDSPSKPLLSYFARLLTYAGLDAPTRAETLVARGVCRIDDDDFLLAVDDFSAALTFDQAHTGALVNRGLAHLLAGQLGDALGDFNAAIGRIPDNAWVWVRRSQVHVALLDTDRALDDLGRALALNPDYRFALLQRAAIRRWSHESVAALADLDRVLEADSEDWYAVRERGWTYHQQGRHAEALRDFERDREANPEDVAAWVRCAVVHSAARDASAARACLNEAFTRRPDDPYALDVSAIAHLRAGEPARALVDLDAAVEAGGDQDWVLTHRAAVRSLLGDEVGAAQDLDRAVAAQNGSRPSYWVYFFRGVHRMLADDCTGALADVLAGIDAMDASDLRYLLWVAATSATRRRTARLVLRMLRSRVRPDDEAWRLRAKDLVRLLSRYWGLDTDASSPRQLRRRDGLAPSVFIATELEAALNEFVRSGPDVYADVWLSVVRNRLGRLSPAESSP